MIIVFVLKAFIEGRPIGAPSLHTLMISLWKARRALARDAPKVV